MHDLARQVGLDLPEFLGRLAAERDAGNGAPGSAPSKRPPAPNP